jgi:hypothetical protein
MITHHHASHVHAATAAESSLKEIVIIKSHLHSAHSSHALKVSEWISDSLFLLFLTSHSVVHLALHIHMRSESHFAKIRSTERLIEEVLIIFIIIKEICKRIFTSEEIFEYFICCSHIEMMEIGTVEVLASII